MTALGFALASACGSVARWALAALGDGRDARSLPPGLPLGTLAVNVTGAFALGVLDGRAPAAATVVGAGLLGSLTTVSGFARGVVDLAAAGRVVAAAGYAGATVALGLGAAAAGMAL